MDHDQSMKPTNNCKRTNKKLPPQQVVRQFNSMTDKSL